MIKLLKADLFRILKSKLLLIITIITLSFPIVMTLIYFLLKKLVEADVGLGGLAGLTINGRTIISEAFALSNNVGIIIPIFVTLFIAMDISNGTLRNKIIAGRSRSEIYFSHLITASTIGSLLILCNVLLSLLLSCLAFGYGVSFDNAELTRLLYFFITGLFTFFFSATISTAVTLSIKSSAASVIISVMSGMVLSIISTIVHTADLTLSNKCLCLIPTYTNSTFLAAGQFEFSSFAIGILTYLVVGAAITVAGFFTFKTKDVK